MLDIWSNVRYLDDMHNNTKAPSILQLVLQYKREGMTQDQAMHKAQRILNEWAQANGHKVGK